MPMLATLHRWIHSLVRLVLIAVILGDPLHALADEGASLLSRDLFFEANVGQFPKSVAYVARGPGYHIIIDERGATHDLGALDGQRQIRLAMAGGFVPESVVASEPLPGKINYFLGNDREQWITNVPTWGRVRLQRVYDGIDVVYHGKGTRAEYDFVVAPGADPSQIELAFDGADNIRIDERGRLVLRAGPDELLTSPPVAYQAQGEERSMVKVAFAQTDGGRISFSLGRYDPARELVIDPVILEYSTSLGGSALDTPTGLQVGSDGTIYVAGRTLSADFQGGPGSLAGMSDVFVSRLSADGSQLLYTTFVGGSGAEFPLDLVVNPTGDAFVVTQTPSSNFPTTLSGFDKVLGGASDYAVVRLDTNGALVYGSYYGGPDEEGAFDDGGIALAPNGNVYITGRTSSIPPYPHRFRKRLPGDVHRTVCLRRGL